MKLRRAVLGWRQADLAERVGVTREYLARIEGGKVVPGDDTARKIEEVLGDATLQRDDDAPDCGTVNGYGEAVLWARPNDRPFAVKVNGPSSFKMGSRLIVDPRVLAADGDLAFVRSKKTGAVRFGYVSFAADAITVRLDGSDEQAVMRRDSSHVLGKVTWVDLR